MKTFLRFAKYMLKYRIQVIIALCCAFVAAGAQGVSLYLTKTLLKIGFDKTASLKVYAQEFDESKWDLIPNFMINLIPEGYFASVICLIVMMVSLVAFGSIIRIFHNYVAFIVCIRAGADIRCALFNRLARLPMLTYVGSPVSERVSRVMRDSRQVVRGFTAMLGRIAGELLRGLAMVGVAFYADWRLALTALILGPVLAGYYVWHGRKLRLLAKKMLAEWANMLGRIIESLQGLEVVKVHTAEDYECVRFRESNDDFINADLPVRWRKSVAAPTIQIMTVLVLAVIAVVAVWNIDKGYSEPGDVAVTLGGLFIAAMSLRPLTIFFNEIAEATAASDRLAQIYRFDEETPTSKNPVMMVPMEDGIEFNNLIFRYPGAHTNALNGISLKIKHGMTVAFVGPNGCGKSTLLSMVPRLYDPTDGSISIDGHDLKTVNLKSLRDQIGVVTQDVILFQDTIQHNIGYGMDDVSSDQIKSAAKQAYADEFIQKKKDGYLTSVGERGLSLSGGERQRLAIARAILRNPRILILDEATSMIDADSEALITEALSEFCKSRTSLVIAHRLSTVVNADQIVVMAEGSVVDQGTHAELLKRCVLYQQLCRTQLVSEDNDPDSEDQPPLIKGTDDNNNDDDLLDEIIND